MPNSEAAIEQTCIGCDKPFQAPSIYHVLCPACEADAKANPGEPEEHQADIERLTRGIPPLFKGAEMAQFSIPAHVAEWIKAPTGFLFVHGKCGTGKTHAAAAMAKYIRRQGKDAKWVRSCELFVDLRNTFNKGAQEREADVLYSMTDKQVTIFDDIGAGKLSDYVAEVWYLIIDTRYGDGSPTIYTSNMDPAELAVAMGDRIASRLVSGTIWHMTGKDRRVAR